MSSGTPIANQVTPPQSGKAGPDLDRRNELEGEVEPEAERPATMGKPERGAVIAGETIAVRPTSPGRKI